MKQDKIFIWMLIVFNVALIAIVLYMKYGNFSKGVSIDEYNRAVTSLKQTNMMVKNMAQFQLFSENSTLPDTITMIDEKGNAIKLQSQLAKPKLILRYSELNCQTCVDAMISEIKANKSIDSNNMLMLAFYKQTSYLYQFKRMNRINMPVYSLQKALLPDTLNVPYFFMLHPNLTTSNVYIPEEGDTAGVKYYLNFIVKKINEGSN